MKIFAWKLLCYHKSHATRELVDRDKLHICICIFKIILLFTMMSTRNWILCIKKNNSVRRSFLCCFYRLLLIEEQANLARPVWEKILCSSKYILTTENAGLTPSKRRQQNSFVQEDQQNYEIDFNNLLNIMGQQKLKEHSRSFGNFGSPHLNI